MAGEYDALIGKYGSGDNTADKTIVVDDDIKNLIDKYSAMSAGEAAAAHTRKSVIGHQGETIPDVVEGAKRGVNVVANSVGKGIGFFDQLLNSNAKVNLDTGQVEVTGPGAERKKAFDKRVEEENKAVPENPSTGYSIGQTLGEIGASSVLTPARTISKGVDIATKALPTINNGVRELAPLANRLTSATYKGGVIGSEFGALTSSGNDESLGRNVGRGLLSGVVAGPAFEGAAIAGKSLANKLITDYGISKTAKLGGLNPEASKYVLDKFEQAGLTPVQIKTELNRLGPNATIADLDPLLLDVTETVAKSGGSGSSLLKGRYAARADEADNAAKTLFEQKLGGKPDLDVARERIVKDAQNAVSGDYKLAHNSPKVLDVQPIVDSIDEQLKSSVGGKTKILKEVKSYIFRNEKDAQGNSISVPKYSAKDLHEVRIGIDSLIEKAGEPTSSMGKNTLSKIKDIRAQVNAELKSIPEMKAADEKFAEEMKVAKGLDIGKEAFSDKTNYNQFARTYIAAPDEVKETIRQGSLAAIGDMLDKGPTGELNAAQKLFERKSVNRDKFLLMHGKNAEDVLDAIHNSLNFRRTERTVEGGSRTAQIQAIQQELGVRPSSQSIPGEFIKGAGIDLIAGTPAVAATISGVKQAGSRGLQSYRAYKTDSKIAGVGDILSRQGAQRDNAVDILDRVQKVRDRRNLLSRDSLLRLPVTLPVALTESANESRK